VYQIRCLRKSMHPQLPARSRDIAGDAKSPLSFLKGGPPEQVRPEGIQSPQNQGSQGPHARSWPRHNRFGQKDSRRPGGVQIAVPITGMRKCSLILAITPQSACTPYPWVRVRPWIVRAISPKSSATLAISK